MFVQYEYYTKFPDGSTSTGQHYVFTKTALSHSHYTLSQVHNQFTNEASQLVSTTRLCCAS